MQNTRVVSVNINGKIPCVSSTPTSIREQKGRIIDWNNARAGPFSVLLLFKEVNERPANILASPLRAAHPDLQSGAAAAHSPQRTDTCAIETDLHLFLEGTMCYHGLVQSI